MPSCHNIRVVPFCPEDAVARVQWMSPHGASVSVPDPADPSTGEKCRKLFKKLPWQRKAIPRMGRTAIYSILGLRLRQRPSSVPADISLAANSRLSRTRVESYRGKVLAIWGSGWTTFRCPSVRAYLVPDTSFIPLHPFRAWRSSLVLTP